MGPEGAKEGGFHLFCCPQEGPWMLSPNSGVIGVQVLRPKRHILLHERKGWHTVPPVKHSGSAKFSCNFPAICPFNCPGVVADAVAQDNDKTNNIQIYVRRFPFKVHRGRGHNFPIFISCRYLVELGLRQLGLLAAEHKTLAHKTLCGYPGHRSSRSCTRAKRLMFPGFRGLHIDLSRLDTRPGDSPSPEGSPAKKIYVMSL